MKNYYTFENFIVDVSNRFAYLMAKDVLEEKRYRNNILFIYGDTGVGKTHLLKAILYKAYKKNSNAKILYISANKLVKELINAIRNEKNNKFINKYESLDILLLDDFQCITGKERIQTELFTIFNELYNKNKQIIIASNSEPKDIQILEENLKRIFEYGIFADITMQTSETKEAILNNKVKNNKLNVDKETIEYISKKADLNIKEMIGIVNTVDSYNKLIQEKMPKKRLDRIIRDITKNHKNHNF